jgi:IPT/TIG domain
MQILGTARRFWSSFAFVVGVSVCGVAFAQPLTITQISPEAGLPGTIVEILGTGFDPTPSANVVTVGGSPARVISGNTTRLQVVALRDVASGPVVVQAGSQAAGSVQKFRREGSTALASPNADSGPELVEGVGFDVDRRYDMAAQGTGQKILVILTAPQDVDPEALAPAGMTARAAVMASVEATNEYFVQVSYGKTSVAYAYTPNWISLTQKRDFYCWQQEDIDRAQLRAAAAQAALDGLLLDPSATQEQIAKAEEVLKKAQEELRAAQNAGNKLQQPDFLFAEALLGAKAVVPDFDTYSDYLFIVAGPFLRGQNFGTTTSFHAESTRLGLRFDISFPGPKGITYVSQGADWGRIAHELSHFFAGGDLYSEGFADGSFLEGNAAHFDLMGDHDSHPLYIGYNIEKRLNYFDESTSPSAPVGNVEFLEWGSTPDHSESYDLVAHARMQDPVGDQARHLLRLKVTDGLFYYVEARQRPDAAAGLDADYVFDPSIPLDRSNPSWKGGVIIYKAVENNNQSNNNERPVSLLPPARMLQVGDSFEDPARTIRITVTQRLADRPATYRVLVEWGHLPAADPNGQFDLRIAPWVPPPWESPDIWVNSPKNDQTVPLRVIYKNHEAGDETKPIGNGDPPWVGHDNTLFARVTNQGVVNTPEPVKVTFYVNTPPGIGDNGSWAPFDTVNVGTLAAGETRLVEAGRKWRPAKGEHTCAKVEITRQMGEVTFDNNQAQENFGEFETGAASPYAPVELDFLARNPYDAPAVMDLQARNVPEKWFVAFDHGSVWLPPRAEKKVYAVIWTDRRPDWSDPDRSPRKPLINLEGWMDRWGDQVFAVGGITAFMQAVRIVDVTLDPRGETNAEKPFVLAVRVTPNTTKPVPISVHIVDPDGNLTVERTTTDSSGQTVYRTQYVAPRAGRYAIQALVLGGSLASEAESEIRRVLVR